VDRLYQASEGNPGHALDLAEHLSRDGAIAHVEGAWLLPQNIDEIPLPGSRAEAERDKLARLPAPVRSIGQRLSIREGAIPLEMCAALSACEGAPCSTHSMHWYARAFWWAPLMATASRASHCD
jgi:hypothetical protein